MALKKCKTIKAVSIRLTQEQYDHLPMCQGRYIRHLIDKDMTPDKEESFLQYMGRVRY